MKEEDLFVLIKYRLVQSEISIEDAKFLLNDQKVTV